jgi:hypothetical protein
MLEITEILKRSNQGITKPFLCKASDDKIYYTKGRAATASGLIKEWLGAQLAQALSLPIPHSQILYADSTVVESYSEEAVLELGESYVFGSEQIAWVTELKYEEIGKISPKLQKDILLFDLWISNEDRTLSELGGNPNLLWQSEQSKLYIIDHNLIFDNDFDLDTFWKTYALRQILSEHVFERIEQKNYQTRMHKALECWQCAWKTIPDDWKILNEDTGLFNPDETLQRLITDAKGDIWKKLP